MWYVNVCNTVTTMAPVLETSFRMSARSSTNMWIPMYSVVVFGERMHTLRDPLKI